MAFQLKVVCVFPLDKAIAVVAPEQITSLSGVATAVGVGETETVITTGNPEHPFVVGVTVYSAVPTLIGEILFRT